MIARDRPRGAVPRRKQVSWRQRWQQLRGRLQLPSLATGDLPWSSWLARGVRIGLVLVLLAAVSLGGLQLQRIVHEMPLRHVLVEGDYQQLDAPALQRQLEAAVRGSFFNANLSELKAIAERQPWAAQVVVYRQWPDTVRVAITEREAVAYWGDDGALLTAVGEVFHPSRVKALSRLPTLVGPRGKAPWVLAQYQAMQAVLTEAGLAPERIELTDRMSWHLRLVNGVEVLVDGQDTVAKLTRFAVFYERQLGADIAAVERVDLRYRNGIAVGWRRAG